MITQSQETTITRESDDTHLMIQELMDSIRGAKCEIERLKSDQLVLKKMCNSHSRHCRNIVWKVNLDDIIEQNICISDHFCYHDQLWKLMLQNDGRRGIGFFLALERPVESHFQVHAVFSAIREGQPAFSKYRQEPFVFGSDRLKIRGLHNFMDHSTIHQYLVFDRSGPSLCRYLILSVQLSEPNKFQVSSTHERSKWMGTTRSASRHKTGKQSNYFTTSPQQLNTKKSLLVPSNSTSSSSPQSEDKGLDYAFSSSTSASLSTNAITDHSDLLSSRQARMHKDLHGPEVSINFNLSNPLLPQSSIRQESTRSPGRFSERPLRSPSHDSNLFRSHGGARLMETAIMRHT